MASLQNDPANDLSLLELLSLFHSNLSGNPEEHSLDEMKTVCDILFSASLLKEEGRAVRARVIFSPPEAVDLPESIGTSIHIVRFSTPLHLTANEIKRLSPAAGFFHSMIAIWPVGNQGFKIWGIMNTGPRWLNLVAGGRKSAGDALPHPIIHLRDPGRLLFFQGHSLIAEWRGSRIYGPQMDVFQSRLLNERFASQRLYLVQSLAEGCLPASLETETYVDLCHLISLQFVKRIINLVRTSGHGGSLVILPNRGEKFEQAMAWIDCKYSTAAESEGERFRRLLLAMIRRVGQLCSDQSNLTDAWAIFQDSSDFELDELEEAFFELARLFSDLMQVDGALVLDQGLNLVGFGGEIRVDRNVLLVGRAQDLDGAVVQPWNVQGDGTRHRSVYRLCSVEPEVIGFVISQDSQVRMIANVDQEVIFWPHTSI